MVDNQYLLPRIYDVTLDHNVTLSALAKSLDATALFICITSGFLSAKLVMSFKTTS